MKEKVKSALQNKLFTGIVFILMGLGLIFAPAEYMLWIVRIMGILLIIAAVVRVIVFIRSEKQAADVVGLVLSLVLLAIGIYFIANPKFVATQIHFVLGILVIIQGAVGLVHAVTVLRKAGVPWVPYVILFLIVIALGVIIVWNPFRAAAWLYRFIGIAMLIGGIADIAAFFMKKKEQ